MTDFQKFKKSVKLGLIAGGVSFGVSLVSFLLSLILPFMALVGILGLVVAVILVPCEIWIYFGHKKTFCQCGHRYDFESEVSYSEIETYITPDRKKMITRIEFECSCGLCGEERTFIKKYTAASIDDKGKETHTNVAREIEKMFKYKI